MNPRCCILLVCVFGMGLASRIPNDAFAGEEIIAVVPKPEAPQVFAGTNAKTKAAWQRHFTLGPNDVVSLAFYGRPELNRGNVMIGPDGRITYLQVQGLMVTGMTLDELRAALEKELEKNYRRAHIIVTPSEFRSKHYYILGKIINKGSFNLDRPMTVIEAVAQAGGLETGVFQLNTVELADLPRSFLIRNQQRVAVNFDRLFRQGDLSQNILVEPDDYIYFPSALANEVYVLGSVKSPSEQGLSMDASVLSAITDAGGFTERAYKQRVLVIRGALDQPQRFAVNMQDILAGRTKDFLLEPRDIVYVADKPWARVEDLADIAATAFIQTMVATWTGGNIGPLIVNPLLPTIK